MEEVGLVTKTGLYYIDGKIRKLTPRECARVQGFPDTFKINPILSQSYKQFGNSVAVKVLISILKKIYATRAFREEAHHGAMERNVG